MAKTWSIVAIATLALAGSATAAFAQSAPAKPKAQSAPGAFVVRGDFNLKDAQFGPQKDRRTLVWDARKGRWGLTLDLSRPDSEAVRGRDVEAGAFFRVTPQLRVGGAVGVGPAQTPVRKPDDRSEAPRVRLETAFKF
ncbi:MAG: NtrZ family periplasmic regulatory protein [Pseudomonadota bacterium]